MHAVYFVAVENKASCLLSHRYSIRVLLDIHAVKGSQNGLDNSGQVGSNRAVASTTIGPRQSQTTQEELCSK